MNRPQAVDAAVEHLRQGQGVEALKLMGVHGLEVGEVLARLTLTEYERPELDRQALMDAIWSDGRPFSWSTEGLDDCCHFCERDRPYDVADTLPKAEEQHAPDCPWLRVLYARTATP